MHGAAVTRASPKKTNVVALLAAIASWVCLKWNLPPAFAGALLLGLTAVWLGIRGYPATREGTPRFRLVFDSSLAATSGLISALLALAIWILIWPQFAAHQAQQEKAHALLASIASDTSATA